MHYPPLGVVYLYPVQKWNNVSQNLTDICRNENNPLILGVYRVLIVHLVHMKFSIRLYIE